jgi:hypothetical protein
MLVVEKSKERCLDGQRYELHLRFAAELTSGWKKKGELVAGK